MTPSGHGALPGTGSDNHLPAAVLGPRIGRSLLPPIPGACAGQLTLADSASPLL